MKQKKMVFVALLTSIALAVSLLEGMFPIPIGVPGAKLGLSNIVIVVTLVQFGIGEAVVVSLLKSFLLMLLTGSVTSFSYSLAGAIFASLVMGAAYRWTMRWFSLIGISELGALAHNAGQLFVAALVLNNAKMFLYLPMLTLMGVFTGYFVGLSANYIVEHLKRVFPT